MATTTRDVSTEILDELGVAKSSFKTIELLRNAFKKYVLLENEALNPNHSSANSIMLENYGRMLSQNFYEQMMYKNEMLPSTAIKLRSLLNRLNDSSISGIYGNPAEIGVVVGFDKADIVRSAVAISGNGLTKRITINKDAEFNFGDRGVFRLEHDVQIMITNFGRVNQNIYAIYNIPSSNERSHFYKITNPFINTQTIRVGNKYILVMHLLVRAFNRNVTEVIMTSGNPDQQIPFEDQLCGFDVYYLGNTSSGYRKLTGYPDGNQTASGYNFNIDINRDTGQQRLGISFSRLPNAMRPVAGESLRITVFTTKGSKGNFIIRDKTISSSPFELSLKQDRNVPEQDAVINMVPYLSIKDFDATGGTDFMDIDKIRDMVIKRGTNVSILTPGELEKEAREHGIIVEKIRDDIRCLEYRASIKLTDSQGYPVPSKTVDLRFMFADIPVNGEVNARIITPKMVFEYDPQDNVCNYVREPETFAEYYDQMRAKLKNQYMFPFHIRFEADSKLDASIFDMIRDNEVEELAFEYFDEHSSSESNIGNLFVARDPIRESVHDLPGGDLANPNTSGYISLTVHVVTSAVVINNLVHDPMNPIVKYRFVVTNRVGGNKYAIDGVVKSVDESTLTVTVVGYLKTHDSIDENGRLCIRDFAMYPVPHIDVPIEYYFVEPSVDVDVYVIERGNETLPSPYDMVLFEDEVSDKFFVSTVYKATNVTLYRKLSNTMEIMADIRVLGAVPRLYSADVPRRYTSNVYETDSTGHIIVDDVEQVIDGETVSVQVPRILHAAGDIIYREDGVTPELEHVAGGVMTDAQGNVIYDQATRNQGILKRVPVYDRICSYPSNFLTIVESYNELLSTLDSLYGKAPSGASLVLGLRNTAGQGAYQIYDQETAQWVDLDRVDISIKIGVKFKDDILSNHAGDIETIIQEIETFVNSMQDISFSMDTVFARLRSLLPSVSFFVGDSINDYPYSRYQAIRKRDGQDLVFDVLNVRRLIDEEKSDMTDPENVRVVFHPDITVREIK